MTSPTELIESGAKQIDKEWKSIKGLEELLGNEKFLLELWKHLDQETRDRMLAEYVYELTHRIEKCLKEVYINGKTSDA